MTEQEFHTLKIGDVLLYRGDRFVIIDTERTYDYSTTPPQDIVWKVHFSNGLNAQVNDNISGLRKV